MTLKSPSRVIGIDPGKNGGLVVITKDDIIAHKCPDTPDGMATLFGIALNGDAPIDVHVVIEQVWARPGNASRAAFSYGVNYGLWIGIVASYEVDLKYVSPQKWMTHIGCPKGMNVTQRKNWLKDKAKKMYPSLKKVTLATADAILIARYGKDITENS
tara:strand:+ start:1836 stop:2309 length:474 start_codon:yes stop_codon:yes gene_type:complete